MLYFFIIYLSLLSNDKNIRTIPYSSFRDFCTSKYGMSPKKEWDKWVDYHKKINQYKKDGVILTGNKNIYRQYGGELNETKVKALITEEKYDTLIFEYVNFRDSIIFRSIWDRQIRTNKVIVFNRCIFHNDVNFGRIVFEKEIWVRGCSFSKGALWALSRFRQPAGFIGCVFNGNADFMWIQGEKVYFSGSHFLGRTQIGVSGISGLADVVSFSPLQSEKIDIEVLKINPLTSIRSGGACIFEDKAEFFSIASEKLLFNSVIFKDDVKFQDLMIGDLIFSDFKFYGTRFSLGTSWHQNITRILDLRNGVVEGVFDMKGLGIGDKCDIFFKGLSYNRIHVNWEELKGKLKFSDKDKIEVIRNVYYPLIQNLRLDGFSDDANDALYVLKNIERKRLNWSKENWDKKIFLWVAWPTCGYALKPLRPIIFSIGIIFFFSILYTILRKEELENINPRYEKLPKSKLKILLFKLENFSNITRYYLLFWVENLKLSISKFVRTDILNKNKGIEVISLFESVLGWLLMALFIITYVNTILK